MLLAYSSLFFCAFLRRSGLISMVLNCRTTPLASGTMAKSERVFSLAGRYPPSTPGILSLDPQMVFS